MNIKQPIIIIGAPRSGTTLLFSIISSHPDLWSLYMESEIVFERYFDLQELGWPAGNQLNENHLTPEISRSLIRDFYRGSNNYQVIFKKSYTKILTNLMWERINRIAHSKLISPLLKPPTIRIVEKNPKNCLRVEMLNALFPDAFFIFLTREPRTNISSLIEGWKQAGKYETYDVPGGLAITGYEGKKWNFLLPPGWMEYARGKRLEEVCAFQYRVANERALAGLRTISPSRTLTIRYEELVAQPRACMEEICNRTGLSYIGGLKEMTETLPLVNSSSPARKDKWKKNERAILSILPDVAEITKHLGYHL